MGRVLVSIICVASYLQLLALLLNGAATPTWWNGELCFVRGSCRSGQHNLLRGRTSHDASLFRRQSRSARQAIAEGKTEKEIAAKAVPISQTVQYISPEEIKYITSLVCERVKIPLLPAGLQKVVLREAVVTIINNLPKYLSSAQLDGLSHIVDGSADGTSPEERDKISDALESILDRRVPLIPAPLRHEVAVQVVRAIIGDRVAVQRQAGREIGGAIVGTTSELLSEEGRKRLASQLNEAVDLPFLNEEQEQVIFEKCSDVLGSFLERLLPPRIQHALDGVSEDELEIFKQDITDKLNGALDVPFMTEEQENKVVRTFIDFYFNGLFFDYGIDGVLLTEEAQISYLDKQLRSSAAKMDLLMRKTAREQSVLERKIARFEQRRHALEVELAAGPANSNTSDRAQEDSPFVITPEGKQWNKRYRNNAFAYLDTEDATELYRDVASRMEKMGVGSVLDVGCWHGNLLKHLTKLESYTGLDASTLALEAARKVEVPFSRHLVAGNMEDMPVPEQHFDAIYFGGCLGYDGDACEATKKRLGYDGDPVDLIEEYADKYSPEYVFWQEATKHANVDKFLPRLWMTDRFDLVDYWQKEYKIENFRGRKFAILRTRSNGVDDPDEDSD